MTATTAQPAGRRAKIVATLGPATIGMERGLVAAGLDVARLNFSHGTRAEHAQACAAIREAAREVGRSVAVLQDLQGPKIRVGRLVAGGPVLCVAGNPLTITTEDIVGNAERVSTTYQALPRDVRPGDRVLLDDGRIVLRVESVLGDEVNTTVELGGPLGEHKGINLPGVAISAPSLTEKDRTDLAFGLTELEVDYVALSFVRRPEDLKQARELIQSHGRDTPLITKLERPEAVEHLEEILAASDAVMVARGDLGVELPTEQVPILQKRIIQQANARGIPAITATQMLESMRIEELPTRAEATDVANAIWDGTDAVMLSAETATGEHPIRVIQMMDRIVRAAESAELPERQWGRRRRTERAPSRPAAITHAASVLAEDLQARAIIGVTRTGRTAELLARRRPDAPIYAFSPDPRVCRQLALWWGVTPVPLPLSDDMAVNLAAMEAALLDAGVRPGETVVLVGAYPFRRGVHTNFLKIHVLGRD